MRLLVDHHISPYIARALAAIGEPDGHEVKAKSKLFDTSVSVPDTEWLGMLARQGGWAFVSDDHRLYRNPQERGGHARGARDWVSFWSPHGASGTSPNTTATPASCCGCRGSPSSARSSSRPRPTGCHFGHGRRLRPIILPRR